MSGAISRYLEEDHKRIDDALRRAVNRGEEIESTAYEEFRGALLRHIGMEERILLPAARSAQGGKSLPQAEQLHLDHGALAALLVPTPTKTIVDAIRSILERHNAIEENSGGVYEPCEQPASLDADAILARLRAAPDVAMAPYTDSTVAIQSLRAALKRAGYSFEL
jgi:hypothetical protein